MCIRDRYPMYRVNRLIYSAMLVRVDYRFEGEYNEDADLCLRALIAGHATFKTNCITAEKVPTGRSKGGNEKLYSGLGHIRKTVYLRRKYPTQITIQQKYGRYAHQCLWRNVPDPSTGLTGEEPRKVFEEYRDNAIIRSV